MEKKNNSFEEVWEVLKGSKNVLMALHPKPDGDSQGSCIAMKSALEEEGVNVKLISRDEISDNMKKFYMDEIEFGKGVEKFDPEEFDYILLLDHGAPNGHSEELIGNVKVRERIVNIDHHETNSFYGKMNYVDKDAPSCASVLVDMFKKLEINFSDKICRSLLLGICTDTNFGEYRNSAETLKKMAFLIEKGKINYQKEFVIPILRSDPWKLKKFQGIILSNMEKKNILGKNIVYSCVTKKEYEKIGLGISDIKMAALILQDLYEWDIIFTLTELDEEIKGSFRSKDLDVTVYAQPLGGGGHKKASGFTLETTDMEEVLGKVLGTIEEKGFLKV